MKAKFVYENIEFTRGDSPKQSMDVGLDVYSTFKYSNTGGGDKGGGYICRNKHYIWSKVAQTLYFVDQPSINATEEDIIGKPKTEEEAIKLIKQHRASLDDINENIVDFKRGGDPKTIMELGTLEFISSGKVQFLFKFRGHYFSLRQQMKPWNWKLYHIGKHLRRTKKGKGVYVNVNNYKDFVHEWEGYNPNTIDLETTMKVLDPIIQKYFNKNISESVDFMRTNNPKETMKVGKYRFSHDLTKENQEIFHERVTPFLLDLVNQIVNKYPKFKENWLEGEINVEHDEGWYIGFGDFLKAEYPSFDESKQYSTLLRMLILYPESIDLEGTWKLEANMFSWQETDIYFYKGKLDQNLIDRVLQLVAAVYFNLPYKDSVDKLIIRG